MIIRNLEIDKFFELFISIKRINSKVTNKYQI